jgi:hypothetical protein
MENSQSCVDKPRRTGLYFRHVAFAYRFRLSRLFDLRGQASAYAHDLGVTTNRPPTAHDSRSWAVLSFGNLLDRHLHLGREFLLVVCRSERDCRHTDRCGHNPQPPCMHIPPDCRDEERMVAVDCAHSDNYPSPSPPWPSPPKPFAQALIAVERLLFSKPANPGVSGQGANHTDAPKARPSRRASP